MILAALPIFYVISLSGFPNLIAIRQTVPSQLVRSAGAI
jgi:hypothetical protein